MTQSRQGQAPGPRQGALLQVLWTPNEHPNITHTLAGNRPEGSGAQAGDSTEAEKPPLQTRGWPWDGNHRNTARRSRAPSGRPPRP